MKSARPVQLRILRQIAEQGPQTMPYMASLFGVQHAAIRHAIAKLESEGLIQAAGFAPRGFNGADRRPRLYDLGPLIARSTSRRIGSSTVHRLAA